MIPKIIHYCWFGGKPMPELALKCIASWKKFLPEYELRLWNEDTFDINSVPYVKEAYEARKFAFVTDYIRLWALEREGGVYMDTDVEVVKPIDEFLTHDAFCGFESFDGINEVCGFLLEYPNLKIEIVGHTDDMGDESYNQRLSERRAESAGKYRCRKRKASPSKAGAVKGFCQCDERQAGRAQGSQRQCREDCRKL